MRREAKPASRAVLGAVAWMASAVLLSTTVGQAGCNKLSDEQCLDVRTQAFTVLNTAHTCNEDAECAPSEWPGCPKPVADKNRIKIQEFWDKFKEGQCAEAEAGSCPETPEVYCKQGLCVFRYRASITGAAPP